MELLDIRPTTIGGLSALLRYAYTYVVDVREWPDSCLYVEGKYGALDVDWSVALHVHAAQSLDAMQGRYNRAPAHPPQRRPLATNRRAFHCS